MSKWKVAKYIRLSQADRDLCQNDAKSESESISHQRDLLDNFIAGHSDLVDAEQMEFFDDGYSGTNFDRPGFERMMEKIRKGEVNCVVVKDFSRFGRDYIELGDYLERIFPVLGVRFLSVNDHYDSENYKGTTGGLDVVMKNIVYTYYSKDLSMKVKSAKHAKMKQGLLVSGMVPYGYQKDPEDCHHMIINPETAPIVREIFDLCLSGMRPEHIAIIMNSKKYDTPAQYYIKKHPDHRMFKDGSDMAVWDGAVIRRILRRKTYYGAVVTHTQESKDLFSKHKTSIPEEEQFVVEGMHEPIITKEEYLKVQEIFPKTGRKKAPLKADYPLYKKVRCGTCGRSCRRDVRNPTLDPHMAYFCNYARSQSGEKRCSMDVIREDTLHEIIWEELQRLIYLTDTNKKRINDGLVKARAEQEQLTIKMADLKKVIRKCESEKMALMEQYLARKIDRDRFQAEKTNLEKQIDIYEADASATKEKLSKLSEWREFEVPSDLEKVRICASATELTKEIADLTVEQCLFFDKDHIEIRLKFSDGFLEMVGMKGEVEENKE